jgi:ABC-type transport system involved in multi-copper enzyme maturation permease subunit
MDIKKGLSFHIESFRRVFSFFFFLGRKTRRTKIFYLISFLPVIMAMVIKFSQILSFRRSLEGIFIFSNMIMVFYLQFLILILAIFFGTSVCSDEVEAKTLTYLTTRPLSKTAIILGKYAAYTLLIILMTAVGLLLCFLILNVEHLLDLSLYRILLRDTMVLILGLICYTSLFTLVGTFLKRSILFGLIFSFGWENVIQYFPGSTQRFAIVHYLKSLIPSPSGGRFSFLLFRLESTSPSTAVLMLFVITGVFLLVAVLIFSQKEYILQD